MTLLTTDDVFLYEGQKVCYICKRRLCYDKTKKEFKLNKKVREIIVISQEYLEDLLIAFVI